jgi:hypothetical protein
MPGDEQGLTMDELRERIRAAGVTIPDERLAMVRKLLGDALVPVRALDSRAVRSLEPAVTFAPPRDLRAARGGVATPRPGEARNG